MLDSGSSITIHCFCLRTAHWTQDELAGFSPDTRLWNATETFVCSSCGRRGKVREIDVHRPDADLEELTKPEKIRKPIALRQQPFGKRASPPKRNDV